MLPDLLTSLGNSRHYTSSSLSERVTFIGILYQTRRNLSTASSLKFGRYDTIYHMTESEAKALVLSADAEIWFVTVSWVAEHYGVSRLRVHRAIKSRKLVAARVAGAGHDAWVLDRRLLPSTFP